MGVLGDHLIAAMENVPEHWSQKTPAQKLPHEQSRAVLEREVHHQLWGTICSLASIHYDLGEQIGMSPQNGYDQEKTIATIHCLNGNVTTKEYKDICDKLAPLLEDLQTFADDHDGIRIMAADGIGLAMIEYDPEELYDTLVCMIDQLYPDDKVSLSHLNAIWHLEERLAHGPAYKLS